MMMTYATSITNYDQFAHARSGNHGVMSEQNKFIYVQAHKIAIFHA